MAVVQAQNLQHLVDLQSAQARANSAQLGIVTDEKKAAVLQQQKETADIGKAFDTVSGVRPPTQTWNVEDFAR